MAATLPMAVPVVPGGTAGTAEMGVALASRPMMTTRYPLAASTRLVDPVDPVATAATELMTAEALVESVEMVVVVVQLALMPMI